MVGIVVGVPIAAGDDSRLKTRLFLVHVLLPDGVVGICSAIDCEAIVPPIVYIVLRGNGVRSYDGNEPVSAGNDFLSHVDVFLSDAVDFVLADRFWA